MPGKIQSSSETSKTDPAQKVLALLQKKDARYKFKQIASATGLNHREIEEAISEIRKTHKNLVYAKFDRTFYLGDTPTWYSNETDLSTVMPTEGVFGVVSDTHLGSVAERLDILKLAFDRFEEVGVKQVFHCGDVTDGWMEYRGHMNFVKVYGSQPQAKRVVQCWPKREGIVTYAIAGNHDMDSYSKDKVDRLSLVTHGFQHEGKDVPARNDFVYLGQYSHTIILPQQVTMHMIHPRGNAAYAMSYKQQKRSEAMDRNLRPDIQLSGHYHTFTYIWVNHTHFIAVPGQQDETEFFKRLGLPRSVGFLLVYYKIEGGKLIYLRPEVHMDE